MVTKRKNTATPPKSAGHYAGTNIGAPEKLTTEEPTPGEDTFRTHLQDLLGGIAGVKSIQFQNMGDTLRVALYGTGGATEKLVLDLYREAPMGAFGQAYMIGTKTPDWWRLIGPESPKVGEQRILNDPSQAFKRYIEIAMGREFAAYRTPQERWEALMTFGGPGVVGKLQMVTTRPEVMTQTALRFRAEEVAFGIPQGVGRPDEIGAINRRISEAITLQRAGTLPPEDYYWYLMKDYLPKTGGSSGAVRYGRYGRSYETPEGVSVMDMFASGDPEKAYKRASVTQGGGLRELSTLLWSAGGGDVRRAQPSEITGMTAAERAGFRMLNITEGGVRRSSLVQLGVMALPGTIYSGAMAQFGEDFWGEGQGEGRIITGAYTKNFVQELPTLTSDVLATAAVETGVFRNVRGKGWVRKRGLEGFTIQPGETATIGLFKYMTSETEETALPINVSAGTMPISFAAGNRQPMLSLPSFYRAGTPFYESTMEQGYQSIDPIARAIQARSPGVIVSARGISPVPQLIFEENVWGGVKLAGEGIKTSVFKSAIPNVGGLPTVGLPTTRIGRATAMIQAVTAEIKSPLQAFKYGVFGTLPNENQQLMLEEFNRVNPTLGGALSQEMANIVSGGQGKQVGVPVERLAKVWATHMGVEYSGESTVNEFFEHMRSTIEALPPETSWIRYGYAALPEKAWRPLEYVSASEKSYLRTVAKQGLGAAARDFLRFKKARGSDLYLAEIYSPAYMTPIAADAIAEYLAKQARMGMAEVESLYAYSPGLAESIPGMAPGAHPAETGYEPPSARSWRALIDVERFTRAPFGERGVYTGAAGGPRPFKVVGASKYDVGEITAYIASQGGDLKTLGKKIRADVLRQETTGALMIGPRALEAATKYEFGEDAERVAVTRLARTYPEAVQAFLADMPPEGDNPYARWIRDLGEMTGKEAEKVAQARYAVGFSGRYGYAAGLPINVGLMDQGQLNTALRRKGKSLGMRGAELEEWLDTVNEQIYTTGGVPNMLFRSPNFATTPMMLVTPEIAQARYGVKFPGGSSVTGNRYNPRIQEGDPFYTGIAGSFGMATVSQIGDWDYDEILALMGVTFSKESGMTIPDEMVIPSSGRAYIKLIQDSIQAAFENRAAEANVLVSDLAKVAGAMPKYMAKKDWAPIPGNIARETGRLRNIAKSGMGVAYNVQRWLKASSTSLLFGAHAITSGLAGALPMYQRYLDYSLKEIEARGGFGELETILSTGIFAYDQSKQMLKIVAKYSGKSRWSTLWASKTIEDQEGNIVPIDLGYGGLQRTLAGAVGASGGYTTATQAFMFAMPGQEKFLEERLRHIQEIAPTLSASAQLTEAIFGPGGPGSEESYDPTQTPVGLAALTVVAGRTTGTFGRNPKLAKIRTEGGEINEVPTVQAARGMLVPIAGQYRPLGELIETDLIQQTSALFAGQARSRHGISPIAQASLGALWEKAKNLPGGAPPVLATIIARLGGERGLAEAYSALQEKNLAKLSMTQVTRELMTNARVPIHASTVVELGQEDAERVRKARMKVIGGAYARLTEDEIVAALGGYSEYAKESMTMGTTFEAQMLKGGSSGEEVYGVERGAARLSFQHFIAGMRSLGYDPGELSNIAADLESRKLDVEIAGTPDLMTMMDTGLRITEYKLKRAKAGIPPEDLAAMRAADPNLALQASMYGIMMRGAAVSFSEKEYSDWFYRSFRSARSLAGLGEAGIRDLAGQFRQATLKGVSLEAIVGVEGWMDPDAEKMPNVFMSPLPIMENLSNVEAKLAAAIRTATDPEAVQQTLSELVSFIPAASNRNQIVRTLQRAGGISPHPGPKSPRVWAPKPGSAGNEGDDGEPPGGEQDIFFDPEDPKRSLASLAAAFNKIAKALPNLTSEQQIRIAFEGSSAEMGQKIGPLVTRGARSLAIAENMPRIQTFKSRYTQALSGIIGEERAASLSLGQAAALAAQENFQRWAEVTRPFQRDIEGGATVYRAQLSAFGAHARGAPITEPDYERGLAGVMFGTSEIGRTLKGTSEIYGMVTGVGGFKGLKQAVYDEEVIKKFTDQIESSTAKLIELDKAIDNTSTTEKDRLELNKQRNIEEAKMRLAEVQVGLPAISAQLQAARAAGAPMADIVDLTKKWSREARAESTIQEQIDRLEGRVAPPSRLTRAGSAASHAMRQIVGGWGLMYMAHLASFPMGALQYGFAQGEEMQMAANVLAAQTGGTDTAAIYSPVQYAVRRNQMAAGGQTFSFLQQMGATIPGGVRDVGGAAMAGVAGGALSLYLASALPAGAGQAFLSAAALPIGIAVTAGTLALSQIAYRSQPEQTRLAIAADYMRMREGQPGAALASLDAWWKGGTGFAPNYTVRAGGKAIEAAASAWLGGEDPLKAYNATVAQMATEATMPVQWRSGRNAPSYEEYTRQVQQGITGLTRQRGFTPTDMMGIAATIAQSEEFTAYDPAAVQAQAYRMMRAGIPPGNAKMLKDLAMAQMAGIPVSDAAWNLSLSMYQPRGAQNLLSLEADLARQGEFGLREVDLGSRMAGSLGRGFQRQLIQSMGLPVGITSTGGWSSPITIAKAMAQWYGTPEWELVQQAGGIASTQAMMGMPTDYRSPNLRAPLSQAQRYETWQYNAMQNVGLQGAQRAGLAGVPWNMATDISQLYRDPMTRGQMSQIMDLADMGASLGISPAQTIGTFMQTSAAFDPVTNTIRAQQTTLAPNYQRRMKLTSAAYGAEAKLRSIYGDVQGMQMYNKIAPMFESNAGAEFMNRVFQMEPIAMTQLGLMGAVGPELAPMDISTGGQITGLSWGTTSINRAGGPSGMMGEAAMAERIWGPNWQQTAGAYAVSPNVPGGKGYTTPFGEPVTGMRALQWRGADLSYQAQMASLGSQMAQINLQREYMPRFHELQTQMAELGYRQQMSNFAYQESMFGIQERQFGLQQQQFALQGTQFYEQMGLNRRGTLMQRRWAQEDWAFQDQTRQMQWQWRQEDFGEQVRFMSGRERRVAERQMGRETIMFGMEGDQITKQRERQKEVWKLEDERHTLQIRHFEETRELQEKQLALQKEAMDLQKQQMEKQKEFYLEGYKLQEEYRELQYEFQMKQLDLAAASIGAQMSYATQIKENNDAIMALQDEQEDYNGLWKIAQQNEEIVIREWNEGLIASRDTLRTIIQEAENALARIRDWTPPDTGDDDDDDGGPSPQGTKIRPKPPFDPPPGKHWEWRNDTWVLVDNITGSQGISIDLDPWRSTIVDNRGRPQRGQETQNITIYIGNERLGKFVLDAVSKDLEV